VRIRTTSLSLKDHSTPPQVPDNRKVAFTSSTQDDPAGNRIVPPPFGGPGDPSIHGAVLVVYNSSGSGEKVVVSLPASFWEASTSAGGGPRYRFRGVDAIKKVDVKDNRITIRGGKSRWNYTLDEPSQGSIAVRLLLGTTPGWCANAPAKASGVPPSTARNDRVDKFTGQKNTPPPGACPAVPP
jgi:hypothetical protein